jgi:hypothetical protein
MEGRHHRSRRTRKLDNLRRKRGVWYVCENKGRIEIDHNSPPFVDDASGREMVVECACGLTIEYALVSCSPQEHICSCGKQLWTLNGVPIDTRLIDRPFFPR